MSVANSDPQMGLRVANVAGVVLAGGRNSRMGGHDKSFLRVGDETSLQRALGVLRCCFDDVGIVSNRPERYTSFGTALTRDEFPGVGPLAGIHAGLGLMHSPFAFVVACDMPFLRVEPIRYLADLADSRYDAVIPWWDGDIEPLHAVYAAALREPIAVAIRSGAMAIRDLLPSLRVRYVVEAEMRTIAGSEESFRNVNTPDDAARYSVQLGPRVAD